MPRNKRKCSEKRESRWRKRWETTLIVNIKLIHILSRCLMLNSKIRDTRFWKMRLTQKHLLWQKNMWVTFQQLHLQIKERQKELVSRLTTFTNSWTLPLKCLHPACQKWIKTNSPSSTVNWLNNYTPIRMITHRPRRHSRGFRKPLNLLRSLGQFP